MRKEQLQPLPERYKRLLKLIPVGLDEPVTAKVLAYQMGVGIRNIRELVNQLITVYGIPIGSVRGEASGYFIPTNDAERFRGMIELDKQVREEQKRIGVIMHGDLTIYQDYMKGG